MSTQSYFGGTTLTRKMKMIASVAISILWIVLSTIISIVSSEHKDLCRNNAHADFYGPFTAKNGSQTG